MYYLMNLPRVGHAVIINNLDAEIPDTENSVEALKNTYQIVGFEVHFHKNCNIGLRL